MNDAFYEEKLADIKDSVDIVFRFQLYRRGKIDEYEEGGKVLGDAIDTLLGCATEYQAIMEENKVLKGMYHETKEKIKELEQKITDLSKESMKNFAEHKIVLKNLVENKSNVVDCTSNRTRKNGENDTQCLDCKEYDKQQGMCRWGECAWYSRKPMCFDMRYCCKTCAFDIDGKCNYLKEHDERENKNKIEKRTFIEDYMKGKKNAEML